MLYDPRVATCVELYPLIYLASTVPPGQGATWNPGFWLLAQRSKRFFPRLVLGMRPKTLIVTLRTKINIQPQKTTMRTLEESYKINLLQSDSDKAKKKENLQQSTAKC